MLRLADAWVWDSWPIDDDGRHHLFFLKAPRHLEDPELRHGNASVGHAVSDDWRSWELLPDALQPSSEPAWDDRAIWTGSVVRGPDRYHLFYTGISRAQGTAVQRIGRADSDDLVHWTRSGTRPVVTADARWYQSADDGGDPAQAWRDPWVYRDQEGIWHMLITAQLRSDEPGSGVVGHAVSEDLGTWEVQPPLSEPGPFGSLEVVQPVTLAGEHHLVASCATSQLNPQYHQAGTQGGIFVIPGDGPVGPWAAERAWRVAHPSLFAARVIDDGGSPALLGFRDVEDGTFIGEIPDPVPLVLEGATSPASEPSVTIKDVALSARVSIKTVSRVINGEAHVSPITRRRVEAAVQRLGYVRNEHAAALRRASEL